ncbi:MAG TPA: serine/threonine-protein kinase [Polyangiaceae bacterium]|nr:serine/threonine-protein kinase [Polyangiaceae bacterium]
MSDEFEPGQLVPGTAYRITKTLGQGAMGAVHAVVDESVDAPYVMKTLLPRLVPNQRAIDLLRTEARVLANLQHPNIVRVFTAGVSRGGTPYFVMDRLIGQTLWDFLQKRGTTPPHRTTIDLVVQMLRGLEHAHEKGIVHRDIKPENVFLHVDGVETRVKLLDFGILKLVEDGQQDAPGAKKVFMGTPRWASPEQIACRAIGPKTDLYSVGLVLYYMLSARLPFQHESMDEVRSWARSATPPPSIAQCVPDLHPALCKIVMSAIEPDPTKRPRDAGAFASELRRIDRILEMSQTQSSTIDMAISDLYDASSTAIEEALEYAKPRQRPFAGEHQPVGFASTVPAPAPVPVANPPAPVPKPVDAGIVASDTELDVSASKKRNAHDPPSGPIYAANVALPLPPIAPPQPLQAGPMPVTGSHGGIARSVGPEIEPPVAAGRSISWYLKVMAGALAVGSLLGGGAILLFLRLSTHTAAQASVPAAVASATELHPSQAAASNATQAREPVAETVRSAASTVGLNAQGLATAAPAASAVRPAAARTRTRPVEDSPPTPAASSSSAPAMALMPAMASSAPATPPPVRVVPSHGSLLGDSWEPETSKGSSAPAPSPSH